MMMDQPLSLAARLQDIAQKSGSNAFWLAMYVLQFASWYYAREEQLSPGGAAGRESGALAHIERAPRAPPRQALEFTTLRAPPGLLDVEGGAGKTPTGKDGKTQSEKLKLVPLLADRRLCSYCGRVVQHPAQSTGGYVFCYLCLVEHVRENGRYCPVSGLPQSMAEIRRLHTG